MNKKIERRKTRQEAKKGTEPTKAEKTEEKQVETPKAATTDSMELEDGWEKVPQKKNRIQTWNVRSADWTAEVMDVEKLGEGINDPSKAAISTVIQVEDGDTWLELRSLVARAESDGTAVMPCTGDQQEEASVRQTMGGELKKVPGVCGQYQRR